MKRVLTTSLLCVIFALAAAMPAGAAEKTVLTYSIKEARAFLWEIHYPQSTFISEKYAPCDVEADTYECDRTRYNQKPGSCPADVALGRTEEAPETPTPDEAADGFTDDAGTGEPADWLKGNPVAVVHGVASGRLSSTPESGGFSSMYYVDNSGRRETEAHAESDAYVGNRNDYEERCAVVDAFSETSMYPGPFRAHMLSRSNQGPSTYSMAAFTTCDLPEPGDTSDQTVCHLEAPDAGLKAAPGASKQSVAISKLWEEGGRVHGVLTSTVRGATLAGGDITVDAVRSVISFSSDGTKKGLVAAGKTTAVGVNIMGTRIGDLEAGQVFPLETIGEHSFLGVIRPFVQTTEDGSRVAIRAPGLFLAANTPLNEICIPEDPFNGDPFQALCSPVDPLNGQNPFPEQFAGEATLGGKLFGEQVVYVAGAILDAGVGRALASAFLPEFPTIPPVLPGPPIIPGVITPPTFGTVPIPPPSQPVALPRFEVRELAGSPWPLLTISILSALGLMAVMGRWSMRFAPVRTISHYPPFPAASWVYRAFLKG